MARVLQSRFGFLSYVHVLFLHIIAYSGRYCEEDRNGCSEVQCYVESSCRDIPAPGVGAECGPCPTGFTGDGNKCLGKCACFMRTLMSSYTVTIQHVKVKWVFTSTIPEATFSMLFYNHYV